MNTLRKRPINSIGYGFVDAAFLPEGKDEYHLRNLQNRSGINYRHLTAYEIEVLVRNNNTSDDWNKLQVSDLFNPELVKHCKFYGLVRIGKLETVSLEYHNVRLPVGLYNSTIISSDFGDNVSIHNVTYLSHYIIGSEVMITNVHELHTTDHSKFGNGIIKEGEEEAVRIWVEVRNENAGRGILPFNGMLPGDAHLWSTYRADRLLMERFKEFTEKKFDRQRGYYGKVGDRCVIKNTSIIKDVWIGSDAYIKGANKLKNLTINSAPDAPSQIGEGCEIVNGIIGFGCRIFYGVKAVRFVMAAHSQLKYGARLINSYLGYNSTISCCEVLNSLIFPAHEQHHNNSFLCAALVMGQSNIAAGATIGSNHNSRAADGEIVTGRGFWPGLCVSLKHNSRFATFTLLAKGDYPHELHIRLPFSLVSQDESRNELVIMPAYWFQYNLYALARNAAKYVDRDKRNKKLQHIEYDYLAPDSLNEMLDALSLMKEAGLDRLAGDTDSLEVRDMECSRRTVRLIKVRQAAAIYRRLIRYHAGLQVALWMNESGDRGSAAFAALVSNAGTRTAWANVGGQLIPQDRLDAALEEMRSGAMNSWDAVHQFYATEAAAYPALKRNHALACWAELEGRPLEWSDLEALFGELMETKAWMVKGIRTAREKDYENPYRMLPYNSKEEMEAVVGSLEDNVFIRQQEEDLERLRSSIKGLLGRMKA